MTRTESITCNGVHGFLAHAERSRGGAVLLPTVFGVDAFVRERAQRLAEHGVTTMVWDPYRGEGVPTDMQSAQARAATLTDDLVADMSQCVEHLGGSLGVGPTAVIGFCLGGRYALLLAARHRPSLAACVAYYPSIRLPAKPNESEDAIAVSAAIECPVHLVHGTGDQVFLHEVFLKLRDRLDARPAPTAVQIFPDAVHSFMRADLQSVPANETATRLSWPPVLAFLDACLAGATPAAVA